VTRSRNPKDIAGSAKPPLHLIPGPARVLVSLAMKDGALKYGPFNWRETPVEASNYTAACERHIAAWFDGEECASDSGISHIAHAIASLMILLDAQQCGSLVDDRPKAGATAKLIEQNTVSK